MHEVLLEKLLGELFERCEHIGTCTCEAVRCAMRCTCFTASLGIIPHGNQLGEED